MITYLETVQKTMEMIKNIPHKNKPVIVVERSFISNRIFASVLHNRGHISAMEYAIYQKYVKKFSSLAPLVDALIYVSVPVNTAMTRVRNRNRRGEKAITFDFQQDLADVHDRVFKSIHCPCIMIDNDIQSNMELSLKKIEQFVQKLKFGSSKL